MARPPRIEYPGALYHVISRGNHRQRIFRAPADYTRYCDFLAQYQQQHSFTLHAYVLMPTHVHLLVEMGPTPLAKIMQGLQQSYALYFNRRYGLVGHLFQGRYKALLCQKNAYLLELVRYLHLNPVRGGLTKSPQAYRWSSHDIYLQGQSRSGVTVAPVLAQFSRERSRAIAAYRSFVQEGMRQPHRADLYEAKEQRYLGDDTFIEEIERRARRAEPPRPVQLALSEVAAAVSQATGVAQELLKAPGRFRAAAQARALVAYLAREIGGLTLTATAHYLGRDQATLSLGVRKLHERQAQDPRLRTMIGRLAETLRQRGRIKYKITNV